VKLVPSTERRARENRTRYVVLGMLGEEPMSGYGLRKAIAGSVGHFWQESYGQLYPALRALAAEGLVEAHATRHGPGRGGATYHVTPRGRKALEQWLAAPPVLVPQRNEILLRVFFAGAVPPEVTVRNLDGVEGTMRGNLAQLEAIAAKMDGSGATAHPDARYWRLTLDFGLDVTRLALDWIERVKSDLAAERRPPARRRAASSRRSR
jgi:DNA-binding PadR family transcriptional regulator